MKKIEHTIAWTFVGLCILALLPWAIFRPVSAYQILDDAIRTFETSENYGEDCSVSVQGASLDTGKSSKEILDALALVNALSVNAISHIRKKDDRSYRFMRYVFPFGASESKAEQQTLILETIYDKGNEYARYDTTGSWIMFPKSMIIDMGDYVQQIFQDQFYSSLNDIKKQSLQVHEVQTAANGKKLYVFRGAQTDASLDAARKLFQYPIGSYEIREQYGEVVVDPDQHSIRKTLLYALFDYSTESDPSIKLHIPLYQECVPVSQKDLDVYPPANSIKTDIDETRQYLLFKVLPKR